MNIGHFVLKAAAYARMFRTTINAQTTTQANRTQVHA